MSFTGTLRAMFGFYLHSVVRTRKTFLAAGLALLVALGFLIAALRAEGAEARVVAYQLFLFVGPLGFLVQFASLFYGLAAVTDEIDGGTAIYLFTRPLSRPAILLGRLLAAAVTVFALLTAINILVLLAANPPGAVAIFLGTEVILLLGALTYTALFALLATVTRHPLAPGLLFIVGWELVISLLQFRINQFTVKFHLLALLPRVLPVRTTGEFGRLFEHIDAVPSVSTAILLALTIAATTLAMRRFNRMEIR